MEDLIYILIGVIWLVFSVIKGTQKKNPPSINDAEEHDESDHRGFEDIMAEILGKQNPREEKPNIEEYKSEQEPEEEQVGMAYQSLEDLYMKERLKNREANLGLDEPEKEILEPETIKRNKPRPQFDLRKAIIYQTILERPYV
ncbi:MAG: hypothetical protein KJ578_05165 [Bacteroidetes bacterium]|nr:hypothetical protein [Bacteroidota bacterium]